VQIARQKVQIFKPRLDNRFSEGQIISHSEMRIASVEVSTSAELLSLVKADTEVVGIDEGQFFDLELPAVCNTLADQGKRVIVAGLDQDYLGKPFEPMPQLLAIAEYITKTLAICMVCGAPANRTYRKVARGGRVVVGGADLYEARCRRCFDLGRKAQAADPIHEFPEGSHETPPTRRRRAGAARSRTPRRRVR
jgi:thymidine kinase